MKLRTTGATIGIACVAVMAMGTTAASAATTEQVRAGDLGQEWHTADTRLDGTLSFETTYGGALGTGAAVLSTPSANAKVQLFTEAHDGTYLRDITALSYATYVDAASAPGPGAPALNIRLDRDDDGLVDAYLVYEPYQDDDVHGVDPVRRGSWQSWDAWNDGRSEWWSGQIAGCGQATPCTIETLVARYPRAVIREDGESLRAGATPQDADFNGAFGFNQGSGNTGLLGAADALRLATSTGVDVTYDFEADVVLGGKQDCKDGGWATSTAPEFRNQGQCVSFFNRYDRRARD